MNKIISLSNVIIGDDFHENILLKNANISFFEGQNVCIYSRSDKEFFTCQKMISVLAGNSKIESGDLSYSRFDDNENRKYIFGFNNFANILNKQVKPIDVIDALITKERITKSNENEIFEIIRFLNLDLYMQDDLLDLSESQKNLFNIIFLLIIKPRILFIDDLPLYGPTTSQIATLKFLKEYLSKYNITLFISSNETIVRKELCHRFIEIDNGKIVDDKEARIYESINANVIDNKTKAFDLDTELDFSLNSSFRSQPHVQQRKQHFTPNFESTSSNIIHRTNLFVNGMNNKSNNKNMDTDSLSHDFDNVLSKNNQMKSNEPLEHMFGDRQINNNSKSNINDIGLNFENNIVNNTKLNSLNNRDNYSSHSDILLNDVNKDNVNNKLQSENINNEIVQDIIDTYIIKRQLEQQIKSPDFVRLSVDIQHKVFDNYERADKLIRENDKTGRYNPYKTSNLNTSPSKEEKPKNYGFTKMILSEDLGLDDYDNESNLKNNLYKSKTSEFDLDDMSSNDYDRNHKLKDNYFEKHNIHNENYNNNFKGVEYKKNNLDDHEEKQEKFKNFFRNRTKETKNEYPSKYESRSNINSRAQRYQSEEFYEPTRNITEKLSRDLKSKSLQNKTAHYSNDNFEPSYTKPKSKPIKTKAIKTRVKKNKIEQLYEEALADQELANDLRDR